MNDKMKILAKIFFSTLYLSAFTFGGGYVIISLMKKKFVNQYHWIEEEEMLDLIAIAQSSPGPIAVNGALVVGYKIAGLLGAFVSILGTIIPPFVIITVVSFFYEMFCTNIYVRWALQGMEAAVAAIIVSITYEMGWNVVKEKSLDLIVIMIVAFICNYFLNVNVVFIVIGCGLIGILEMLSDRKKGEQS